jgi:hypothetical protein
MIGESRGVLNVMLVRDSVGIKDFVEITMPYEWPCHDVTDLRPL